MGRWLREVGEMCAFDLLCVLSERDKMDGVHSFMAGLRCVHDTPGQKCGSGEARVQA